MTSRCHGSSLLVTQVAGDTSEHDAKTTRHVYQRAIVTAHTCCLGGDEFTDWLRAALRGRGLLAALLEASAQPLITYTVL